MKNGKAKALPSISFEELWEIMEDAVENISYDRVPQDWRTMPELGDDPDDEEIEPGNTASDPSLEQLTMTKMTKISEKASVHETNQKAPRISIAGVCERDIDLLLLEEFQSSPSFLLWFTESILGKGTPALAFVSARRSVRYAFGEIDLEIVLTEPSGKEVRLLIENKVSANFQPNQAERYHESGSSHVSSKKASVYHTVLIAPAEYFGKNQSTKGFNQTCTYEAIRQWFKDATELGVRRNYKVALLSSAIDKGTLNYQPLEDAPVTEFWQAYYEMAKELAPELEMVPPVGKPSGAGFIYFRPREILPPGFDICHKFKKSHVDLHIKGYGNRLNDVTKSLSLHFRGGMKPYSAGVSAAIRMEVPRLDPGRPFSDQEAEARAGLEAAMELLNWFREKQEFMPTPALKATNKKAK